MEKGIKYYRLRVSCETNEEWGIELKMLIDSTK